MAGTVSEKERNLCRNKRSVTGAELKRMCPQQRARHQAYQEPPKEVQKMITATNQRLCARKAEARTQKENWEKEDVEKKRQDTLIGQLKAAEARNRIRLMRLRYQKARAQEINLMIACQPTAQKAVRLEILLPAKVSKFSISDSFDKLERSRIEEILEDERGLTINRG
ncbi:protein LKAAEAR1-like isoform X2 [Megalops cyprinoides]|uniref:protein LKAAEAR1-like isoform X1 n=1 Tax=Megalops cyprinoides TaxID=118141 RepID=UPI0018648974|nr:protein LKAAEAR1-like isoform X1 [Megalops cyprinoides]XP_036390300.1 protein LKAAEAR1-like isoform X1 [Megalops cyprinoides]XP_036390301.1 protein LKAAEAR1-like isoform X2 [Megalops cyprinoides]